MKSRAQGWEDTRTRLCLPRALPLKHDPRILETQSCLVLSFHLRLCYPGFTRSSGFPGLRDSAFKTALYINDICSIQNDLLVINFGSFSNKPINLTRATSFLGTKGLILK